ncbi:MAG: hypothetical protein HY270_09495 [Deltaproteobacteria bacterium]|nr:hypothetical protein [Deltaproteobacteria bacterium]
MNLRRLALSVATVLSLGTLPTWALTFQVNTVSDAPDMMPGDGVCATMVGTCSLRAAVEEANALSGPDVVELPASPLKLTLGELDIGSELAIHGSGASLSAVRGNRRNRLLHVEIGASVSISGTAMKNGSADYGGAILNDGTLTVSDALIAANRVKRIDGGLGAGIFNNGTLTLLRTTLASNRALGCGCAFGGGLFNNGDASLDQVVLSRNRASGCGGAIFHNTGTLQINDSTLEYNSAGNSGGGLFHQDGIAQVEGTLLHRNRARKIGGGVFTYAELHVENSTLSSNYSKVGGGLFSSLTPITNLNNVTIAANHASDGAGILNNGSVTLHNTLVAANLPHNCSGNPLSSSGHNLSSDATCSLAANGDMVGINPVIGPLAANGGPTWTQALLASSPAIDAGDNVNCPAADQRGVARPLDGDLNGTSTCDIGAFEVSP